MSGIEPLSLLIGGAGVGKVFSRLSQGRAEREAAEINSAYMLRDAEIKDQNRKAEVKQLQIAAEDKRRSNRRTLSTIRAAYGSSGFTMEGSPMDVLEDTAGEQELDVQRIEYDARLKSRAGAFEVLGLKEQARITRQEGRNAQRAGYIAAATGALGTGAKIAGVEG